MKIVSENKFSRKTYFNTFASRLKKEYGDTVPIVITENGVSDRIGNLDDLHRIYFFKHYLNQLLKGNVIYLYRVSQQDFTTEK